MKGLCFNHFIFPTCQTRTSSRAGSEATRWWWPISSSSPGLLGGKRLPTPLYTLSTHHFFQVPSVFTVNIVFPEGRKAERTSGCGRIKKKNKTVRHCPDLVLCFPIVTELSGHLRSWVRFRDSPESAVFHTLRCYRGAHVGNPAS